VGSAEGTAGEGEHAVATIASAIALHQRGQLDAARAIYLALLHADQNNVDALHFLGVLLHQQGESLLATELVRRAIALQPGYSDAHNNLGNIYQQLGATLDAVKAYEKALELRPEHPDASRNLGIALRKLKRHEEAIEVHLRAAEREPGDVQNYYALANAYKDMGRVDEALATLRKALAMRPEPEGFRRLGQLLYGLRRTDEAAANYRAWLEVEPASPVASHMLAACTGQDIPERAGDAFVAAVFDGFAESFDEVLVQRLEYRAPALLGEALRRLAGEPRGVLDIADAGCGTGLLAQHLRPYARHLVGVDLSPKMLLKAQRRGAYDRLIVVELGLFLRSEREAFDVVASSDTLVYFGDLREVLAAAARALRAGGLLLFTLEHETDEAAAPQGYRLHPHGRYSHTEPYVRASLAEAGFGMIELARAHLRREGVSYVDGLVVLARRASPEEGARALHRQAELAYEEGRWLSALNLARRAIDSSPGFSDAHYHAGRIYEKLGVIGGAVEAYQKALELEPDHREASGSLAPVLAELKRLEESAEAHRRAFEQEPGNAEHLYALAAVFGRIGRTDDELAALRKALAIRPDADAFRRAGSILSGRGRLDEMAALYEAWLRAEPDNPVARHLFAASTGKDVPARASDAYVAQGFDRYADTFDEALRKLEYRAPALLGEVLRRIEGEPRGDRDIVDAGCGTGLLAPHLRPYARRLVGVDLSPRMLEKAAGGARYDDTAVAELTAFLRASPGAFDIVASSDTLPYFGDLREVLAAARTALRPGGRLLFTLEHALDADQAPEGYRLHPDGRYMHTEPYVHGKLAEADFELVEVGKTHLRRDGEAYVAGLIVAARTRRAASEKF
jgi:predicted TPR repeat methyltransferase